MLEVRCARTRRTFVICPTAPDGLFGKDLLLDEGFREGAADGLRVVEAEDGGGDVEVVAREVAEADEGGGAVGVGEMVRDDGLVVALGWVAG